MNRFAAALFCTLFVLSCTRATEGPPPAPVASAPASKPEQTPPEQVVEAFGRRLKQVSTLAPPDVAAKAIRESYGSLVAPTLLQRWTGDPASAPGRQVSSPWPDRIEVTNTSRTGDVVEIEGVLVEATSSGDAGRTPVELELRQMHDAWRITAYAKRAEEPDETQAAIDALRDYYAAIDARDYDRAYRRWGSSGPPNQSREQFAAGFADTASVRIEPGPPSRIEGAAGSRYIDIPVTIEATMKNGERRQFSGTYTLRRSVVEGADPLDRVWHIDRASIHPRPG